MYPPDPIRSPVKRLLRQSKSCEDTENIKNIVLHFSRTPAEETITYFASGTLATPSSRIVDGEQLNLRHQISTCTGRRREDGLTLTE